MRVTISAGLALGPATGSTSFDLPRFFVVPQPMDALEAGLAAHAPAGMSQYGTGQGSGDNGSFLEVTYLVESVPAGIASAQIVLTVVPAGSGGSLLRADAQILWYPSRTAAEYIDPGRYRVLTIDATIWGQRVYGVHKVVTSRALIAPLAQALNRSPAQPPVAIACPSDSETYLADPFGIPAQSPRRRDLRDGVRLRRLRRHRQRPAPARPRRPGCRSRRSPPSPSLVARVRRSAHEPAERLHQFAGHPLRSKHPIKSWP